MPIAPFVGGWAVACLLVLCPAILVAAEPPATASLPPIFNGRDLAGWKIPAEPYWTVTDGVLVGQSDEAKKGSMLYTEKEYGDVIVEGEVRFTGPVTDIATGRLDITLPNRKPVAADLVARFNGQGVLGVPGGSTVSVSAPCSGFTFTP